MNTSTSCIQPKAGDAKALEFSGKLTLSKLDETEQAEYLVTLGDTQLPVIMFPKLLRFLEKNQGEHCTLWVNPLPWKDTVKVFMPFAAKIGEQTCSSIRSIELCELSWEVAGWPREEIDRFQDEFKKWAVHVELRAAANYLRAYVRKHAVPLNKMENRK